MSVHVIVAAVDERDYNAVWSTRTHISTFFLANLLAHFHCGTPPIAAIASTVESTAGFAAGQGRKSVIVSTLIATIAPSLWRHQFFYG